MIKVKHKGSFKNTERFFRNAMSRNLKAIFDKYGTLGVQALAEATPKDTMRTSEHWSYRISATGSGYMLEFVNDNVAGRSNVAVLLQFGHATKNGAYVQGIDYINPALRPVFNALSEELWVEITSR